LAFFQLYQKKSNQKLDQKAETSFQNTHCR
jgi:hypothetical protein